MLLAIIDRKMSYFLIFLQNSVETVPIVTVLLERDGVSFMISLDERLRSGHWFDTRFMIAHTCSSGLNIVLIDTVFANLSIWFLDHIQVALALLEKGIEYIFLQIYFFFILLLPTSKWYYLHVFQPPLDICICNIDDPIVNSLILVEFSSWDSLLEETTMVTYMMVVTVWKRNKWLYEMVILVSKVKISWAF